ncbi:hypothetical protein DPEC_G00121230 [Dallia pectoralis]|uniref:Uncharacterized protein n=1 Tax=Dallia pectoralis TaxID=75939 RepID=A0ACC2GPU3_DALPE|nr:hypothetical protein DPEC_G00121230 [Dallia pectoralis]
MCHVPLHIPEGFAVCCCRLAVGLRSYGFIGWEIYGGDDDDDGEKAGDTVLRICEEQHRHPSLRRAYRWIDYK